MPQHHSQLRPSSPRHASLGARGTSCRSALFLHSFIFWRNSEAEHIDIILLATRRTSSRTVGVRFRATRRAGAAFCIVFTWQALRLLSPSSSRPGSGLKRCVTSTCRCGNVARPMICNSPLFPARAGSKRLPNGGKVYGEERLLGPPAVGLCIPYAPADALDARHAASGRFLQGC